MRDEAAVSEVISRYEAKYLVTEAMVDAIRDHIRGICSPDRHAGADGRYRVNNLYFDTPDLRFYQDTRFKQYTRFKPRVRFYGDRPEDWLWLELKHKVRNVTWKSRRRVDVSRLPGLFEDGVLPEGLAPAACLTDSFEAVVARFGASPILQVQYVREPYVSDLDVYGRVTFDRRLMCRRLSGPDSFVAGEPFVSFDDPVSQGVASGQSLVVLEIKTDVRVPGWVQGMIRRFGLERRGFSKYCCALERSCPERIPCDRISAFPMPRERVAEPARTGLWPWRRRDPRVAQG